MYCSMCIRFRETLHSYQRGMKTRYFTYVPYPPNNIGNIALHRLTMLGFYPYNCVSPPRFNPDIYANRTPTAMQIAGFWFWQMFVLSMWHKNLPFLKRLMVNDNMIDLGIHHYHAVNTPRWICRKLRSLKGSTP